LLKSMKINCLTRHRFISCIILMQHVNDSMFITENSTCFHLASLCACLVHVVTYYLVSLFCPHVWELLPCLTDWLVDWLVGRISPTSPCPPFGWLPYWVSAQFELWWEWKHETCTHTSCANKPAPQWNSSFNHIAHLQEVVSSRTSVELLSLNFNLYVLPMLFQY
jgi:hypothetical protein